VNYLRFKLASWWAWVISPTIVAVFTLLLSALVYSLWKKYDDKKKEEEHM
jgi:phosphate/sulfate permease